MNLFQNLFGNAATRELQAINAALVQLNRKVNEIMTTQAELAVQIESISAQVTKVAGEITGKIAALEAALTQSGAVPLTANQQAALDSLTATVATLDAIVPDAPAPV